MNSLERNLSRKVTASYCGEEHEHLLCLWGLMLAEEQNYDVTRIDIDREGAQKSVGGKGKEPNPKNVSRMVELLWISRLPFDENLPLRDLAMSVGFADMPDVKAAVDKVIDRQLDSRTKEEIEKYVDRRKEDKKKPDDRGDRGTPPRNDWDRPRASAMADTSRDRSNHKGVGEEGAAPVRDAG